MRFRFASLGLAICLTLAMASPAFGLTARKDVGGDNRDDVAFLYDYGGSKSAVFVLDGDGTGTGAPRKLWGSASWYASKSTPLLGDVTGDGKTDVVMAYSYGTATTGLWTVPGAAGSSSAGLWWKSAANGWSAAKTKWTASKAFSGTGPSNPVALYDYGNGQTGIFVFSVHSASLFNPHLVWKSGVGGFPWSRCKAVGGDFNGDGFGDLAVVYDYGNNTTGVFEFLSNGSSYVIKRVWKSSAGGWYWSRTRPVAGDVNGDGRDELVLEYLHPSATDMPRSGLWVFKQPAGMTPSMSVTLYSKDAMPPFVFPLTLSDLNVDGKQDAAFVGTGSSDYGTSLNWMLSSGTAFDAEMLYVGWESGGFTYEKCRLIP